MFRNYLKVALRNSWKNKLTTFINLFSLAFGIGACLIIYLFIKDEQAFDAFHTHKDHIYRLNEIQSFPGTNTQHVALSMPGMGPNLKKIIQRSVVFPVFGGVGVDSSRKVINVF